MKGIINKALFAMLISANFIGTSYSMDTLNEDLANQYINAFRAAAGAGITAFNAAKKSTPEVVEIIEPSIADASIVDTGISAGKTILNTNLWNRGLQYTYDAGNTAVQYFNDYCAQPAKNGMQNAYNTGKPYVLNGAQYAQQKSVAAYNAGKDIAFNTANNLKNGAQYVQQKSVAAYNNGTQYLNNNVVPVIKAHSDELAAGTAGVVTGVAYEAGLVGKVGRGIKNGFNRIYTYAKNNPANFIATSLVLASPAVIAGYEYNAQLLNAIKNAAPLATAVYATVANYVKVNYPTILKNAGIYAASTFGTIGANRARLAIANVRTVAAEVAAGQSVAAQVAPVAVEVAAEQPEEAPVAPVAVAPVAVEIIAEQPIAPVAVVDAIVAPVVEEVIAEQPVAPVAVEVPVVEQKSALEKQKEDITAQINTLDSEYLTTTNGTNFTEERRNTYLKKRNALKQQLEQFNQ